MSLQRLTRSYATNRQFTSCYPYILGFIYISLCIYPSFISYFKVLMLVTDPSGTIQILQLQSSQLPLKVKDKFSLTDITLLLPFLQ